VALAASTLENAAGREIRRFIGIDIRSGTTERSGRHIMTRTAHELAEFLACTLGGDGTVQLAGVAAPGPATVSDLIYVRRPAI